MIIQLMRKLLLAALEQDKPLTKVLIEYHNFINVFFSDRMKLLYYTRIKEYAIEHIQARLHSHCPIYSISLAKLQFLKTYKETYLKPGFIHFFKSPARMPLLFQNKWYKSFISMSIIET